MRKEPAFPGWVRVDDRLIHGQVTVGWRQHLAYREIWVIDDDVRQDPFLGDALRLAAPAGVVVRVMGVAEAVDTMTAEGASASVLVLVREPQVAVALLEGGVSITQLNVGNLASRPGSVRAFKNVSLTEMQIAALDRLTAQGVEVFFQLAPEDTRLTWMSVRRRLGS
jgi:PTS system mannose-specific IIB component